jgi:hypothetical protein
LKLTALSETLAFIAVKLKYPNHFGNEDSSIYKIRDRNDPTMTIFTMGCGA